MQQTILLFPLDNWHQGFCHRPRRKDLKNLRLSKIGDFSPIFGSGPFMPQLHPHPLMHRTPAAPVDLSEQFCPDTREGTRTVWHLTRAMTSVPNTLSPAGSIFSNVNLILPTKQPLLVFFQQGDARGIISFVTQRDLLRSSSMHAF